MFLDTAHELNNENASHKSLTKKQTATLEEQLSAERNAMAHALGGAEGAEGIRAFLGKRKPVFR